MSKDRQEPVETSVSMTTTDFGRTIPDRPVPTTARLSFVRNSRCFTVSSASQIRRLQRLAWSDPNVHRAKSMAHQECGWKHGERAVFLYRIVGRYNASSDPGSIAVNGIDRGRPSHGRVARLGSWMTFVLRRSLFVVTSPCHPLVFFGK